MKHKLVLVMLILLIAVPMNPQTSTPAPDQTSGTGFELVKTCGISTTLTDFKALMAQTYCLGLIHGVYGEMAAEGSLHVATFVSNGQMVLVVKKYLDEHPEQLGEPDIALIFNALIAAFPPTEENRKRLANPACRPILQP